MSIANQIIAYESGELDQEQVIELFEGLIRSGKINHLQGSYQRIANQLIEEGYINL